MKENSFDEKKIKLNELKAHVAVSRFELDVVSAVEEFLKSAEGKLLNCKIAESLQDHLCQNVTGIERAFCRIFRDDFNRDQITLHVSLHAESYIGRYEIAPEKYSFISIPSVNVNFKGCPARSPRIDMSKTKIYSSKESLAERLEMYIDAVCHYNLYCKRNEEILKLIDKYIERQPLCLLLKDLKFVSRHLYY